MHQPDTESLPPPPPPQPPPIEKPVFASPGRAALLLRDLKAALAGGHHDYTEERLGRAILLLAIPMVLEMVMESIFAVVDIFWVSHLGPDAIAVVGITESMMTLVYAVAIGLSIAATAVVARRVGEKDADGAAIAAVQVIFLGAVSALILGVIGAILAPHLLHVMGASPDAIARGGSFTRIMLGGNATVFLIFLINAVFRGAGDAAIAMRTLWLANFLNIMLGPCFIFGWGPFPELGVAGAAVATNTGRGIGVLYQLFSLVRRSRQLTVRRRHLRIDRAVMGNVVRIAIDGIGQLLINTTSWVGLMRLMAPFGSVALAGYAVTMRVVMFAILPAWGLSNAAATLVGQNLGAKHPERAEQAVWTAARYNLYFLGAVGVVFVAFAGPIVRLFPGGAEMQAFGTTALRIVGLGFPFYAYGLVLSSAFNGAGDTRTPTIMNLFCFWIWEIPLAWVLARPLEVGAQGIVVAVAVAFSTLAVVSVIVFRRGRWKSQRV
ncbi:MAG TPA: MATE family efflux transporter [Kofleriaceae bacterium]|jgi:putative MATE family efflux protein|nr:MATE family efflux transporter [Kofleriaceae bacterium]